MCFFKKPKELTQDEINQIPKSFEIIGSILIFSNFPKKLNKLLVGQHLLKKLKSIKTIAIKSRFFSGKYRTPKIKIIAGEKTKETIHKENGVLIKVNPEKVYYSSKSSTERLRIAVQVKKGESVLTMFSGVAPFPLVISKHSEAKEIYGIEINPEGHKYGQENLKLNKTKNIFLYQGNVKKILPKLKKKFDRIIMPLPKNSENYLELAKKYLNPKGIIHLYIFEKEENFQKLKDKYSEEFQVKLFKAGSPAPGKFRVCLDLQSKI